MHTEYKIYIGTLYLIFILLSGLLSTAFSVLSKLELSGPGVQFIADNKLYYSLTSAYTVTMIIFILMPDIISTFSKFLFSSLLEIYAKHYVSLIYRSVILRFIILLTVYVVSYALLCEPYIVSISISACILGFHIYRISTKGSLGSSFSYATKLLLDLSFINAF